MSLCLFLLFKEILSVQFFWNIQRKADYPRAMQEFEMPHQMFVMMTKHYQVQSEHRRIQNPFKHLRLSIFAKTVTGLKSLTDYAKTLHLRYLKGLWTRLCWKPWKLFRTLSNFQDGGFCKKLWTAFSFWIFLEKGPS